MASLACGWLKLADEREGMPGSAPIGGSGAKQLSNELDEFHFLKDFVKQKFDAEKLGTVFSNGGEVHKSSSSSKCESTLIGEII